MRKPNIELLKRLRTRFLRMRHRKHFNMHAIAARTDCGSAMCIAGHSLDLAGYKMRLRPDATEAREIWEGRTDYDFISPAGRKVRDPLDAAARELGLQLSWFGKGAALELFHDYKLRTPKQAAKRIDRLIKEFEAN